MSVVALRRRNRGHAGGAIGDEVHLRLAVLLDAEQVRIDTQGDRLVARAAALQQLCDGLIGGEPGGMRPIERGDRACDQCVVEDDLAGRLARNGQSRTPCGFAVSPTASTPVSRKTRWRSSSGCAGAVGNWAGVVHEHRS